MKKTPKSIGVKYKIKRKKPILTCRNCKYFNKNFVCNNQRGSFVKYPNESICDLFELK